MPPQLTAKSPKKQIYAAAKKCGLKGTGISKLNKAELYKAYRTQCTSSPKTVAQSPKLVGEVTDAELKHFYTKVQAHGKPFKSFAQFKSVVTDIDKEVDTIEENDVELAKMLHRAIGGTFLMYGTMKLFEYGGKYTRGLVVLVAVLQHNPAVLDAFISLAEQGLVYAGKQTVEFVKGTVAPSVASWIAAHPTEAVVIFALTTLGARTIGIIREAIHNYQKTTEYEEEVEKRIYVQRRMKALSPRK